LGDGVARGHFNARNDALREFKMLSLPFSMPSRAIRRIIAPKGELFCIT
jgi:hypothetical protein